MCDSSGRYKIYSLKILLALTFNQPLRKGNTAEGAMGGFVQADLIFIEVLCFFIIFIDFRIGALSYILQDVEISSLGGEYHFMCDSSG